MEPEHILISGKQAAMARAALGWNLPKVREQTGFSVNTVCGFENGKGVRADTVRRLAEVYQSAGVRFLPDGKTVAAPD